MLTRRLLFKSVLCLTLLFSAVSAYAQPFLPHEPLDPAKAQSLPLTPMEIVSKGKVHHFQVEVARTNAQQETGLMHRTELAPDRGMLFPYDTPQVMKFWMRNTFIPLDMLFMRGDGVVAAVVENVQPHDERPVGPDEPMAAQLELPAGTVAHLGIKVGDVVRHAAFKNLR